MNSFLMSIDPQLAAIQEEGSVKLITYIKRRPLKYAKFKQIAAKFKLSPEQCGELLNLSRSSLYRLKSTSIIDSQASFRALELANIWTIGLSTFDNNENAFTEWLNTPNKMMGKKTPKELLATGFGFSFVNKELLRIEHSIY